MSGQVFDRWFTDYPPTHRLAGQSVEVTPVRADAVEDRPCAPACTPDSEQCTCGGEDSDGRMDVLRCSVHGIGPEAWNTDPDGFRKRTEEALRIARRRSFEAPDPNYPGGSSSEPSWADRAMDWKNRALEAEARCEALTEALREAYSQLTDGEGLGPDVSEEAVEAARETIAGALVAPSSETTS